MWRLMFGVFAGSDQRVYSLQTWQMLKVHRVKILAWTPRGSVNRTANLEEASIFLFAATMNFKNQFLMHQKQGRRHLNADMLLIESCNLWWIFKNSRLQQTTEIQHILKKRCNAFGHKTSFVPKNIENALDVLKAFLISVTPASSQYYPIYKFWWNSEFIWNCSRDPKLSKDTQYVSKMMHKTCRIFPFDGEASVYSTKHPTVSMKSWSKLFHRIVY